MKIVFLASATSDLRWFKQYYIKAFPAGRQNADQQYRALLQLLRTNPEVGERVEGFLDVRKFPINRTPFTVLYRTRPAHIEILRLFDQRSGFANEPRL